MKCKPLEEDAPVPDERTVLVAYHRKAFCASLIVFAAGLARAKEPETLLPLVSGIPPQSYEEMWKGFDPRAEPLETEILHEWQEDGVQMRVVRFRIGVFKGVPARLAGVYGFPIDAAAEGRSLPGLLQIHGGGQYADANACLQNAQRGYATLSVAWAGRINAPGYRVTPAEVQLFWAGDTANPRYKATSDWGLVDGYHAPSRHPGNAFPSIRPAEWTLDPVESPRNSGWFLCAVAARRALTFLERQPEVDPNRLGVYGHSMGGKLTVMTAPDRRVKAAAPSCGGISDRYNDSPLFRQTLGDDVSLRHIACPILFLSPANDFHGRIGDLPRAVEEIGSRQWRVVCSPHHNHQDTPEYEAAAMLWFDDHLRGVFEFPLAPQSELDLSAGDGVPRIKVVPDRRLPIHSIEVFYTQQGKPQETPGDRDHTVHRFWHFSRPREVDGGAWVAPLPLHGPDAPLWVFANVRYKLAQPVSGAGYYYRTYSTDEFCVSSLLQIVAPESLQTAGVRPVLQPTNTIETFDGDWEKEWFTYRPQQWGRTTHKVYDPMWQAPPDARLRLIVRAQQANKLVVRIDQFAAQVDIDGDTQWQEIVLNPDDFRDAGGDALPGWQDIRELELTAATTLRPDRGSSIQRRSLGGAWQGPPPEFQLLQWYVPAQ
ncbi:MAG: hypothetical protein D6753_06450 [Planctomycetota bacterium]|nr:MAG: hypothetical protein D6753_06450 [Planctomycetota bacterium]